MTYNLLIQLARYLKFYIKDCLIVLISLLTVSGSLLVFGYKLKILVDNGIKAQQLKAINESMFSLIIIIIIFSIGSFCRSYFINNIAEKIINTIRIEIFNNLLKLEVVQFENLKISDIITSLIGDIKSVSTIIINFLSFFIRNLIILIGGLILMFIQSPTLSLIVVIGVPILLFPIIKIAKHVRSLSRESMQKESKMASEFSETFSNIITIFAFNQQHNRLIEFEKQLDEFNYISSKRLKARSLFFALSISIILLCIILVIWIGSNNIIKGELTSGQMLSFIYYALIVGMSTGGIAELFSEIQTPLASLERVFQFVNMKTKGNSLNYANSQIVDISKPNFISFENVTFSYPARPLLNVLENLSFNINMNKFIAIVGKSGSGKSTIIQLLLKFYNIQNGKINFGGMDLNLIDNTTLRSTIAYVPQVSNIFSGTIKSNLIFSNPEIAEEEVINIANLTGIMEFANNLKEGINTEIGERGVRLSGGQKQRIAIARAMIYKPSILILDEATSALDSESEQNIITMLQNFMKGKTIISIAHRISSIESVDEILVIDKGRAQAIGNHSELLDKSNIYRILCEEQGLVS